MIDALWGWPPPVFDPAGPYADSVTILAWALLAMGVAVSAIVIAALWVALKGPEKYRRKLGGEAAVWVGGIAFPAVVLTGLLIWGLTLTASLSKPIEGDEMRIRVTGEMWWFRVEYLDDNGDVVMSDANEIHLPVNVPVVLELRSADVIHSFWIPHLSGKKDMVPGRTLLLRVEANREGRFGGVCAEYCGGAHALMGFVAIAREPGDWQRWFEARRERETAASPPIDANPVGGPPDDGDGRGLFMDSGCAACHRIAGTQANGLAGPDLTFVGERVTIGGGILPNHRGTMMGWIGDSQSLKPGNRMPSYDRLSAGELEAIAVWLEDPR